MLHHEENNVSDNFEELIPLSIENLFLMETITVKEIVEIFEKISLIVKIPVNFALLLFRIHKILLWDFEKISNHFTMK